MRLFNISPVCQLVRYFEYLRLAVEQRFPVMEERKIYCTLKMARNLIQKHEFHRRIPSEISYWMRKLKKAYKNGERIREKEAYLLDKHLSTWRGKIEEIFMNMRLLELRIRGRIDYFSLIDGGPRVYFERERNWNKLSKVAKEDLEDVGKCLLSDIPTPSVMACLRVVEAVFRRYYKKETGREVGGRRWVECIKELKEKDGINQTLIGHLDFIRKHERNPAQHPGRRFSHQAAENIFLRSIEVIEEMFQRL